MKRVGTLRLPGFNRSLHDLVSSLSPRALLPLGLAIVALFAVVGPVTDVVNGGRLPASLVVRNTLFASFVALGYAFGWMRRNLWLFLFTLTANVAFSIFGSRGFLQSSPPLAAADVPMRLQRDGTAIVLLMVTSYSCFLRFINGTASRYLRVHAEMELAHAIHQVLVPAIDVRHGDYEFTGFSAPSGEVGGDLVDVVPVDAGWFGYVADVSGHGVSSGVVMGMFKSALRMRLRQSGSLASMLGDLNAVLLPLKSSAMFVTLACVRGGAGGALEYAVAGHLPILRVRADGGVDEITTPQIPIGVFEDYAFVSGSMVCERGELLALITDGLTEVFDATDRELGLDPVKTLLASSRGRPLREIGDAIVSMARAHGAQMDDQTLLLIRRL